MTQMALGHTFVAAMAALDSASIRRTAEFLDDLVQDPEAVAFEADADLNPDDHTARLIRVTDDLRVIARNDGSLLMLLFVGHFDEAWDWARANCFGSDRPRAGMRIAVDEIPGAPVPGLAAVPMQGAWYCPVSDGYQLSRALQAAGIEHGSHY